MRKMGRTTGLYIIKEYQRGVVLRLGKFKKLMGPGFKVLFPAIDEVWKVDMRELTFDMPPQEVITRDTVSVKVNAVVFYKVVDAPRSVFKAQNFQKLTGERAQVELREILSSMHLEDILTKREQISIKLQKELDKATDPWGIKVTSVKVKDVLLPQSMTRTMAKEAEADREKKARIIKAEAEKEAVKIMSAASAELEKHPAILELRRLQTINEIGAENNTTTVVMLPTEITSMLNRRK